MATTAKATAYLDLNITGFDSAIKTAKNLMAGLAATFAAYKIEKFFEDGIKGAIDFGKEMQSASRAMGGFDPGALLLTQKALEKAGMGAEEARGHIGDFIKEGRNVADLFQGADNYAAALKSAAADYGSQASVLSHSAEKLQSVWNTMESIGSKVKTFFLTMTEQFVLPLQTALDKLNQIDLAGVGAKFGSSISKAATILIGLFKNGNMMEAIKLGLTLAFQESVNWLIGGLKYAAEFTRVTLYNAMIGAYGSSIQFLYGIWKEFLDTGIISGTYNAIVGAWARAYQFMLNGYAEVLENIRAGTIYALVVAFQKATKAIKAIFSTEFWVGMWEGFKGFMVNLKDGMIEAFDAAIRFLVYKLPNALKDAWDGFKSYVTGEGGNILNAKSFNDIKNSSLVRADALRGASGFMGGIASNAEGKASPFYDLMDKAKHLLTAGKTLTMGAFEKGTAFDTTESGKKLQELIKKGFKTGVQLENESRDKHAKDGEGAKQVLNQFSGSSSHVIADSLAKVGGGGGFLVSGQSLAAKSLAVQTRAAKANEESEKALHSIDKKMSPIQKPALMTR